MLNLDSLQAVVDTDYSVVPTDFEAVLFFFLEKGVDFNAFCDLPLPYIFSMLKANRYVNEETRKATKS
jgi:hypothetical protein